MSFSHKPRSLVDAQKRCGVRIERASSWNGGKATRSLTASAIVHDGSCTKPAGEEQRMKCRDDDSCIVQGERNAETATKGESTTTG